MQRPRGYIALDRGIFEHPLFRRRPDWLVAWEWLIGRAAWKPEGRRCDHGVVHVERGQLAITLRSVGRTWGWPKSNVDWFLKRLVDEEMVILEKTRTRTRTSTRTLAHPVTLITICNYEKFQDATARAQKPGQEVGRGPGQGIQETLPLQGLPPSQPLNHVTKELRGIETTKEFRNVEKSGDKRQASKGQRAICPSDGAANGKVIFARVGAQYWDLYAEDYRTVTGTEPFPTKYEDGHSGKWFKRNGEAGLPLPKRGFA